MKILLSPAKRVGGNVLLMTIVVTGLIGFLLVAYLTLVQNQNAATVRSQAWNSAIPVIEAGIEDALAHLNLHGPTNLTCDGWTNADNGVQMQRWIGGNFYVVTITNWFTGPSTLPDANNAPTIESRGYVTMPLLLASANGPLLANVVSMPGSSSNYLGRGVRVHTVRNYIFTKGMVARDRIDLNGNNIHTDSFDSNDPLYSTNGVYTPSKIKANGDIASNASITNSVNVGNADIYGHVSTGPHGTVAIGANGSVGDMNWHANGNQGIQSGYSKNDMNVNFPDVTVPFTGGFTPGGGWITNTVTTISTNDSTSTSITYPTGTPESVVTNLTTSSAYPSGSLGPVTTNYIGNSGNIRDYTYPLFTATYIGYTTNTMTTSTYYDYILNQDGDYQISTLSGSVYVGGKVRLNVTTTLSITSMTIKTGKSLNLYSGASSVSLSGNNTANSDGTADSFAFWGLPTCTSISFNGNAGFTGTIYAPNAAFTLNGGGNNTIDFIGASVTTNATMNGHFNFHYDEALGKFGPNRGFVVTSWNEMLPSEVPVIRAH